MDDAKVATALGLTEDAARAALSRMAARGRLRRVDVGLYVEARHG